MPPFEYCPLPDLLLVLLVGDGVDEDHVDPGAVFQPLHLIYYAACLKQQGVVYKYKWCPKKVTITTIGIQPSINKHKSKQMNIPKCYKGNRCVIWYKIYLHDG